MLKHKLKMITLLAVIILSLMIPIVRAENETSVEPVSEATEENSSTTSEEAQANSNNGESNSQTSYENNFKNGDVYLSGDDITIDYIVDGNLFVFANSVTINSQIGGDAFICAGTVNIGEQGYIFSNLFAFAKNVNVSGVVYDLYTAAQEVTINGYVYRDIRVGADSLNINGTIGRNAFVNAENINFDQSSDSEEQFISKAIINGDFNYTSKEEISIPEGVVSGSSNFTQSKDTESNSKSIQDYIMSLGTFVVTIVIIWLLCLWLAPKFLKNNVSLLTTKKILPVIGFGILTPIVGILLAILLFVIGITSNIALLLLVVLFVLIAISTSIFAITINYIICDKLKIQKTTGVFGMLIVSSIVLWLIGLIPFVGSFVNIVAAILGLGIIISSLVLKEKVEDTKNENKD